MKRLWLEAHLIRLSLRLYLLATTTNEEQLSCLLAAAPLGDGGWVGRNLKGKLICFGSLK